LTEWQFSLQFEANFHSILALPVKKTTLQEIYKFHASVKTQQAHDQIMSLVESCTFRTPLLESGVDSDLQEMGANSCGTNFNLSKMGAKTIIDTAVHFQAKSRDSKLTQFLI
jgi:hypothetical protein